jgi:hypothetical protein
MAINSILVWLRAFEHLRVFPFMGYMVRYRESANMGELIDTGFIHSALELKWP